MSIYPLRWLHAGYKRLFHHSFFWKPSRYPEHGTERKNIPSGSGTQNLVTTSAKIYNGIGCLTAVSIYYYLTLYWSDYLFTFDTILAVYFAEHCGWANEKARKNGQRNLQETPGSFSDLDAAEKAKSHAHLKSLPNSEQGFIAAIVGYREDPAIFTKALESYLDADGCQFLLTCIDGNEPQDLVMADIFQKVYPNRSATLDLPVPLVELALQIDRKKDIWDQDATTIEKCITFAKQTLVKHKIHLTGPDAINHLCVTQPHMHKKGIMFTSFIICFAVSELLNIEFVWTSDSDSMVYKDTIKTTIETIYGDKSCAGASTALNIHNRKDNLVTTLGNAIYLNDLHLTRCFSSAVGSNDCQSGPCAAFRIKAVKSELLAWYKQTVCGNWMVINEDRHMTTRLLLSGHRIRYISHAVTATETPVTLRRWLLQQVRWARAAHIEALFHPKIYLNQPPLFFYAAMRREVTSWFIFVSIISYLFVGVSPLIRFVPRDYLAKFLLTAVYLKTRNPINPTWSEWIWSIPAAMFYLVPLPAIQAWSFVTLLANDWGTSMRGESEKMVKDRWIELKKKVWEVGFFVVWMGIAGGVVSRYISLELDLDPWTSKLCMGGGATIMWMASGYWFMAITE